MTELRVIADDASISIKMEKKCVGNVRMLGDGMSRVKKKMVELNRQAFENAMELDVTNDGQAGGWQGGE